MKRIILILGLVIASVTLANAQYAYPTEIKSRGSKIFVDGEKLTAQQAAELFSEIGGEGIGESYLNNRKGYRTGITLTAVGVPMFVLGSATYCAGITVILVTLGQAQKEAEAFIYTGVATAISGAALTLAGIPTAAVHRHRIKKATVACNGAVNSQQEITISPARSGIGLAINF